MRRAIQLMAFAVSAILLTSCTHKELCNIHPHIKKVRIEFDWQDAPDADPEGMCVYFYPESGGHPYRFDFRGLDGGEVELQVGEYRILCYNNDTESVLFRNQERYDLHGCYTREGDMFEPIYGSAANRAPRVHGTESQPVVISPDMLWGCTASRVRLSDRGLSYVSMSLSASKAEDQHVTEIKDTEEQVIVLYPHEQVCTYTYEVRGIKYLKHVVQVSGSLSGMSGSLLFASEELGAECVTLPFEAYSDGVSKITGGFYTFGHNEDSSEPHHMTFYVWMDDGQKYAYGIDAGEKFNVTGQIHGAPDRRHVHIVIDGLDLPQPIENGDGFDVSVDDWDVIEEDILL